MRNVKFLVLSSLALVSLAEEILGNELPKPRTHAEPNCMNIIDGVEKLYNCSGVVVTTVDKDRNVKINCDGQPLNCSGLPSLNFGMHRPIQNLLIERCAVPDNLMCVLERLNATGLRTLNFWSVSTPLTVETVRGLEMIVNLLIYRATSSILGSPGPQTEVPVEVIKHLPNLEELRMQEVEITSLVPVAFNQSGGLPLNYLELSLNNITELFADTFYGLPKLTTLNLYKNNIMTINVTAFRGLDSLQSLYLDDNYITALPIGVFNGTPLLQELTLLNNQQPLRLQAGVLSGLQNLKMLDINIYDGLQLDPQSLSNLPSLENLEMKSCNITELPDDLFLGTTAIVNLTLKSNKLKSLPDTVFSNLGKLERLDLSDNLLESVSSVTFSLLTALKEIQLDKNRLTILPDDLFSSLRDLLKVNLSGNLVSDVRNAFRGAQAHSLDLSHNKLTWSCGNYNPTNSRLHLCIEPQYNTMPDNPEIQSPLNSMLDLEDLDLSYNSIQGICHDWLHTMLNLKTLNLSYNNLTKIIAEDANFSSMGIVVDLRNNQIACVEPPRYMMHYPTLLLGSNPYNCNCKLYHVLDQLNSLSYDVTDAACTLPESLKGVSLTSVADGQRTSHISMLNLTCPIDPPDNCKCLDRPELYRTECECSDITNQTLPDPGYGKTMALTLRSVNNLDEIPSFVNELNLSNLQLETIPDIPVNVMHVDLRDNRLAEIPLKILQRNITLQLRGNKLKCGCWDSEQVKIINKYQEKIKDYRDLICTNEKKLKAIDLATMCSTENASAYGASLFIITISIAVGIICSYRYSLEIKVYLFNRGWTFLVKEEAIDKNKKYDIFLSFVHEDEDFVVDTLLPELDKDYKVCVHTRDWLVGDNIVEQIYRSVADSRRTLIVLSAAFLESNSWSMEEFRAVQTQTAADKIPRGIIILLGDVNCDAAPEIIRRHLDINTYIKWGDGMFWDRLRYALPKNKLKAEDVRRREFTAKAVKNLAKGALHVAVNGDGQLVNTNLKRNGCDIMNIQNELIIANLGNNDANIQIENDEVIANNLKNERLSNINNLNVHNNNLNGNLNNQYFNNIR